jgi:hypothetical protein
MTQEEIKTTDIWELYQKGQNFMSKIYANTDMNFRMYNGDQWAGLKIKGVEKIQHNFIKKIVKHKVGTITANLFAVNYSPENIETNEFMEIAQKTCDLLNKKASKVWDKDFMDKKIKKVCRKSAINGESIVYVDYDETNNIPINEIISKNDIIFGDENEEEIQLQPWIIIRQRKTISELQTLARNYEVKEEDVLNIRGDSDLGSASGESAKNEIEDKCWLLTKLYRENGTVHFSQATKYCDLKNDIDTGLTLYQIAHYNWEDVEGSARGIGEVEQLIPNQLETNKTAMRRALTIKNIAYPQKVVNIDLINNPDAINRVGSTIKFKNVGNVRASDVFMNASAGTISPDSEKFQNELINLSTEINNAGDAVTGNINPESASGRAILAVQNAQNQPLNDQLIGLKSFIEDLARIWFEMWRVYAKDGLLIEDEQTDNITGQKTTNQVLVPQYVLEALRTSVKVDITPKGAFDKYAQELSLENMFTAGKITFEEYVEALDTDSVMPKQKLEIILKKRTEKEKQINEYELQAAQLKNQAQKEMSYAQDIENISSAGNEMINQATANM